MLLNLLAVLMLVLITFFISMQGLLAAMILLVLAVLSSAVAFGFYEDLYSGLLMQWLPAEGEAVSLMAIFLVTLLVLRLVVDLGIKGNVLIPAKIDKIGAGVLGFFAGMVMTGVAMTAVQMLPYDHEILGFKRYSGQVVSGKPVEGGLFLGVDRFAAGLAGIIVDGSLSGKSAEEGSFEENHPDLLGQFDARRSAGPVDSAAKDATVEVRQVWWPDRIGQTMADSGTKFLAVRVKASGKETTFTPAQFRLVIKEGGRIQQFVPRGAGNGQEPPVEVQLLDKFTLPSALDLVFQVPASVTKAWYVTYNGWAKGEIDEEKMKDTTPPVMGSGSSAEPAKDRPAPKPAASAEPAKPRSPAGRTHGADVTAQPTVSDDFPEGLAIPRNEIATGAEMISSRLKDGHVVVPMSATSKAKIVGNVSRFEVPEGQRLVQVPLHRVLPGSLAGQAIDFTLRTLQQQWALVDDAGGKYLPVGAVAIAKVGGQEILEIQYHMAQENRMSGHTLGRWQRITDQDLKQPNARLIFLYLVPPGKHIVQFDTGRAMTDLDVTVK